MKKIFLLSAAASILTITSFSQTKWGVQVMAGSSSGSLKDAEEDFALGAKSIFAYGVGVVSEMPLSKDISFRPSLNFLKKGLAVGFNFSESGYREEFEFKTDLYYAELPLNFTYNSNLKFGKVFFGAGPSLAVGLSGKAKIKYVYQDPGMPIEIDEENGEAFTSQDNDGLGLKRFEISASVIGGVQFNNGFFANAGGLFGLNSLTPADEEGGYKHKGFHLTVGMFFDRKK